MTAAQVARLAFAEELLAQVDNFLRFRELLNRPPRRIALTAAQVDSLHAIDALTWTDGPDGPRMFLRGVRVVDQAPRQ